MRASTTSLLPPAHRPRASLLCRAPNRTLGRTCCSWLQHGPRPSSRCLSRTVLSPCARSGRTWPIFSPSCRYRQEMAVTFLNPPPPPRQCPRHPTKARKRKRRRRARRASNATACALCLRVSFKGPPSLGAFSVLSSLSTPSSPPSSSQPTRSTFSTAPTSSFSCSARTPSSTSWKTLPCMKRRSFWWRTATCCPTSTCLLRGCSCTSSGTHTTTCACCSHLRPC
mmetsp:Transcript_31313/g.78591  ORF Transcript_31313/g.78591 Transcript_31313/m.78591 type:complete len:225 (-) Transcript_31313:1223-1897(-)